MIWSDMDEERDEYGNLTPLALALKAIKFSGCDCGTDEPGTCLPDLCETVIKAQWQEITGLKAEIKRLRGLGNASVPQVSAEFIAVFVEAGRESEGT